MHSVVVGCCQLFVVKQHRCNSEGYDLWMLSTFLLVDQRPGVFIRFIDWWVSSELSGRSALCGGPSGFVSEVDLVQC
jgi:hypothetical protein